MSDGPAAADHLSLDALAELEEGIAADADALRGHLDGCPACRARAGQLRASRALLSALPADPMPADVAARIDAALAAEPAPAPGFARGGDIVPMRARRAWWRGPNLAAAAAGVAALALGSALIVGHLGGKSAPAENADKSAHPAAGTGGVAAAPVTLKQWQTGSDYNAANRAALVAVLVARQPPPFPTPTPATVGSTATTPPPAPASFSRDSLRDPATVIACAGLLAGHPVLPIAVDYARYEGAPAAIVVLPGLNNPAGELDVYVIRSACSNSAPDITFFRVARPR